jgi:HAD superfamily hydrolase (TIGR01509 family)
MPFELIVFDCDGVLVDSERIANRVFCEQLDDLGLPVTLEDMFARFVGHSMPQCMAIVTEMLGSPPPEGFERDLRRKIAAALHAGIEPVAGVVEVLEGLDVPSCVASSGDHAKIRLTLGATGLLERFEGRIFSVTEVDRPKPAPDVFLHAAARMGVAPESCAVVEDSPAGVRAGVAAGMRVFGFAAATPEDRLRAAGAHEVFARMADLPRLLARGR